MFEILRQVQESIAAVQETCSHEEYAAYRKAVGKVVVSDNVLSWQDHVYTAQAGYGCAQQCT
jgi:phage portal protein BeeE